MCFWQVNILNGVAVASTATEVIANISARIALVLSSGATV
ncbi:hypothetical protein OKW21_001594 [Catalinimonas alkaloidigena]|nr:hypothetical protein [Catalinimonas alkaloidigena]